MAGVPERLSIYEIEADIVRHLREERRLILSAPTGSGKSTQVPQILFKHGFLGDGDGHVVILQPRRLAARMLAARVAFELGTKLGQGVGFQIRFENVSGPHTRIKYVTEGILLRQMLRDPALPGVRAIVFDEFHERHLYGDISLARALDLQETIRPDLLIIVMSATLELRTLEGYLAPCKVLRSEGRAFPVEIEFLEERAASADAPIWEQTADAYARHIRAGGEGDVLVFMPGGYEIQRTMEAIRNRPESRGTVLLPLHGDLPPDAHDAAVGRCDQTKVVVATNVAETSLTIDGIRLVIDSGLARIPKYDPYRAINTLLIEKISQASAEQRAGRAGRTAPGRCIRLWSESEHRGRPIRELPEIKRLDLAEVILTIKAAGVVDLRKFRWLDPPEESVLLRAEELLTDLGAIGKDGAITEVGRRMLAFPVHPRYSRMLLAAQVHGCVYQAALIAALTQGRDLLLRKVDRDTRDQREMLFGEKAASDFFHLMRGWSYASKQGFSVEACRKVGLHSQTARQVGPLLQHFLRIAEEEGLATDPKPASDEAIQKCLLAGFSDRVARRIDQGTLRCELVHGRKGVLGRESVVHHAPLLVASEIREIQGREGEMNTILSLATAIEPDWLREFFPEDLITNTRVFYDSSAKRVYADEEIRFRGLPIASRRVEPPPLATASRILAEEVVAGRLVLKRWDHAAEQWLLRVNQLAKWCPEFELPAIGEEARLHLVEQITEGAFTFREIKEREVRGVIRSWLSSAQQELVETHAPERVKLTNDRTPKITYSADGPPFIALRIQELFGVKQTPTIALKRVPVLVQILAPNMRPVQITQDLAGFWQEHYPRIKQELQRKYPKHEWR